MNAWLLNLLSQFGLVLVIHVEPPVSVLQRFINVQLASFRQGSHKRGMAQRQLVTLIDLPEMPCLPIQPYNLSHSLCFQLLPFVSLTFGVRGGRRQDQHS